MARRTGILANGLRVVEVLVVALATVGAFVLLAVFGTTAALDGIKLVAP
jgi:hypothetical protein